jgi:hypothetical protein
VSILHLTCKSCGAPFESGVPFLPEHLRGIRLRALEVCPVCGAAADYQAREYVEPPGDTDHPEPSETAHRDEAKATHGKPPAARRQPADGDEADIPLRPA